MRDRKMSISVRENYPRDSRVITILPQQRTCKHPKLFDNFVTVEGNAYDLNYCIDMVLKLKINTIRTSPTIALRISEFLEKIGYKNIKLFVLNGEPLSELTRQKLKREFPNATIIRLCGMTEFCLLGYQCENLYGTEKYHTVPEEFNRYEVLLDNRQIKEYGEGELVITTLWKDSASPLIRYRTGDMVILSENNCKCGVKGKILSLCGRVNVEGVRVGGITLHKKNIDVAISALGDLKDYQVHVYEEQKDGKILPKIVLYIVGKDEKKIQDAENRLMENLELTPSYNWKNAVEKGIFEPIEIRFVSEIKSKVRKSLGVIDHRINEGGLLK